MRIGNHAGRAKVVESVKESHLYHCKHCKQTVWRNETKRWITSFCERTGKTTRLWRIMPTCRQCGLPESAHCQMDEPGVDHATGCKRMHHTFQGLVRK